MNAEAKTEGRHIFMDDELTENLKRVFDGLAAHGVIGDPEGEVSYGYVRVSSRGQAEEGRSGLPRQLEHIAEVAKQRGFAIPWDMLYCDDHSGFTFEDRPGLLALLKEAQMSPRARRLVMEYPDRMSRDHTWRYGYIREQFENYGIEYVYWRGYHSEIERSVVGTMSEQGMKKDLERMYYGTLDKARSGRIIAKTPAYGYKFVDSQGKDRTDPTSEWRSDTHYALVEQEAEVMRYIYRSLALDGATLIGLADELNEKQIPPPKSCSQWEATLISKMVKNPVYKGEFVAHRWYYKKIWSEKSERVVTRKFERPREEWIVVPVPAIVSPQVWDLALKALEKNRSVARRNARYDFLLVNFLTCAECGYSYIAGAHIQRKYGKEYLCPYYRCVTRNYRPKVVREKVGCTQSQISAKILDPIVWKVITEILTRPEMIARAMDDYYEKTGVKNVQAQIQFIEREIKQREREDEKLYRAYLADVFDEQEYADRRRALLNAINLLETEKRKLEATVIDREEFERRKEKVLTVARDIHSGARDLDLPYAEKRRIIKILVDDILLNVNEGWFKIQGAFTGAYSIHDGKFISIPMDTGSSRR